MNISKLNKIEVIALLLIIMANKIILNLPSLIITATGSSAWLNTIFIVLLAFAFILVCIKLMKNFGGMDIIDISEYLGGTFLKAVVSVAQIFLITVIINVVIRNFSDTIKTIYFKQSPEIFIVLLLIFAATIANKLGIKAISKTCLYIVPLAFIGLLIMLFVPAKDFEIQRIFPILGYGFNKTFITGITNIYALSGLGYIFLLPTLLKENSDLKKSSIIALSISGIFLFLSVLCLLFVFSFYVNPNENMTLYLLTMVVHHGNFIHGINVIFLIVWILSIISYISIALFFILFIIKKVGRLSDTKSINYSFSSIFIALSYVLQNNTKIYNFTEGFLKNAILIFVFVAIPLLLVLANLKKHLSKS